ncbi:hypothetical protein [Pedobacter paludis]|uniref:Uncharacterized protein n=1 Tax=Pedobacter paludis TaxID=2203212 RepID=A0A317F1A0_9SPHI|nr:hypothetical protein [Pedobacter paludis]PWS31659.1 hypothetical protein DF947_13825 [Pedobacter paludis]
MKNRAGRVALDNGGMNISAKALTFSPSIMPEAGEQGAETPIRPVGTFPLKGEGSMMQKNLGAL